MTVYRRPDPIPLRRTTMPSSSVLSAVRSEVEDLNRLVAREIFLAILSGRFAAGSILPNEHQLAAELGVSRTALREAIKGLAAKGLVETRRKRGTQVLDRSRWNMLDAELIGWSRREGSLRVSTELWAALTQTQPVLAALAASRRQAEPVARAATALAAATTPETRRTAWARLMLDIADASGNRFLASLTASCLENLLAEDPSYLDRAIAGLDVRAAGRLPAALSAGDAEVAEATMRQALNAPAPAAVG